MGEKINIDDIIQDKTIKSADILNKYSDSECKYIRDELFKRLKSIFPFVTDEEYKDDLMKIILFLPRLNDMTYRELSLYGELNWYITNEENKTKHLLERITEEYNKTLDIYQRNLKLYPEQVESFFNKYWYFLRKIFLFEEGKQIQALIKNYLDRKDYFESCKQAEALR